MSKILIKQPNGLYCYYSTVVNAIVVYDMNIEGIKKERIRWANRDVEWENEHWLPQEIERADEDAELDTALGYYLNWNDIRESIMRRSDKGQKEIVKYCEKKNDQEK